MLCSSFTVFNPLPNCMGLIGSCCLSIFVIFGTIFTLKNLQLWAVNVRVMNVVKMEMDAFPLAAQTIIDLLVLEAKCCSHFLRIAYLIKVWSILAFNPKISVQRPGLDVFKSYLIYKNSKLYICIWKYFSFLINI